MSDEEKFDKTIKQSRKGLAKQGINFLIVDKELPIRHAVSWRIWLKIDNLVQIGKTLFVFEGKAKQEEKAISQLLDYLQSLQSFHYDNVQEGLFFPYSPNLIRLFYYSVKRHEIIEY